MQRALGVETSAGAITPTANGEKPSRIAFIPANADIEKSRRAIAHELLHTLDVVDGSKLDTTKLTVEEQCKSSIEINPGPHDSFELSRDKHFLAEANLMGGITNADSYWISEDDWNTALTFLVKGLNP